jgi:hypothetical protein
MRKGRITVTLLATVAFAILLAGPPAQARSTVTVTLDTQHHEFTSGVMNQGWWDQAGLHSPTNDNYEVGNAPDGGAQILRNFFSFDGSIVTGGCAASATLQIPIGVGSGDFGGVSTFTNYVLHDVSTASVTLSTSAGPDLGIFHDLGTGTVLGNRVLPTFGPYFGLTAFPVPLNSSGLAALNAAITADKFFSVGGMIDHEPNDTSLYGFTPDEDHLGNDIPTKLVINLGSC